MALSQERRNEMADIVDRGASWIGHRGRAEQLRVVARELRGEPEPKAPAPKPAEVDEPDKPATESAVSTTRQTTKAPVKKAAAKRTASDSNQ